MIDRAMEKSLPLHDVHESLGASFTPAFGFRIAERYGEPGDEYRRLRESAGVIDRSYRGLLSITGPEAEVFLDRMLSSEVSKLEPGHGQRSALLTPKGKVLGACRTYQVAENDYVLRFAEPVSEEFLAAMEKYAFLSDVQVLDDSGERCAFTIAGPRAGEVAAGALGGSLPPTPGGVRREVHWQSEAAVVYDGDVDVEVAGEVDVEIDGERGEALWRALLEAAATVGGGPVGFAAEEIVRVERGRPRLGVDYTTDNFPGEAGLEGALTYTKCYVGQEVVARMRTYGHANRALRGVQLDAGSDPGLVDELRGAPVTAGDREIGRLTSCVVSPRHGIIGLSVLHRGGWAPGTRVTVGDAVEAIVRELPFEP